MNGATAEPDVKKIRLPSKTMQTMIGSSQNFFRSLMKDQSSNRNSYMGTPHVGIICRHYMELTLVVADLFNTVLSGEMAAWIGESLDKFQRPAAVLVPSGLFPSSA